MIALFTLGLDFHGGERFAQNNTCGECGSPLTTWHDGQEWAIKCTKDKGHNGFKEIPSISQLIRQGEAVPISITNQLKRRRLKKAMETLPIEAQRGTLSIEKPEALAGVVMARWDLEPAQAMLFCLLSLRMGLDPLLNEVYPIPFTNKKTGKKTVVPIVSEQGVISQAARACPEAFNGPPSVELVTDPILKEALCGDPNAWVWKAKGRRKDWEPGREYETYGWMTKAQEKDAQANYKPSGELPGNQARVRAIKRWFAECYPEAASKMRDATKLLQAEASGDGEMMHVIEAEYRFIDSQPQRLPPGQHQSRPAAKPSAPTIYQRGGPDPEAIKGTDELKLICGRRWGMNIPDICKEGNVNDLMQIVDPMVVYRAIKAVKEPSA